MNFGDFGWAASKFVPTVVACALTQEERDDLPMPAVRLVIDEQDATVGKIGRKNSVGWVQGRGCCYFASVHCKVLRIDHRA